MPSRIPVIGSIISRAWTAIRRSPRTLVLFITCQARTTIRPRLGILALDTLVYCVPVYVLLWYFGLIDELFARILISVLVTLVLPLECLSPPKLSPRRWDLAGFGLFFLIVLLFSAGKKFNVNLLSNIAAVALMILPWCWLLWQLMRRQWLLVVGFILALLAMMTYWTVAWNRVDGPHELLLLPIPAVVLCGTIWAPMAFGVLEIANRCKNHRIRGPGTQALAMVSLFVPTIVIAAIIPETFDLGSLWTAASLTLVGFLLSAVVAEPLRRFLLELGNLRPDLIDTPDTRDITQTKQKARGSGC